MCNAALEYAKKGKPVFPCGRDKRPMIGGGFKNASTDETQIRDWWAMWPGAMIGMPTGRASGVVAIDCDCKNGIDGRESLRVLAAPHGGLPDTIEILTPSGGCHLWYEAPNAEIRNSASKLAPGVDVRGEGGYVIVPPSAVLGGKRYELEASSPASPAPMPRWLVERCRQPERKEPPPGGQSDGVGQGSRSDYLARYAGRLAYAGLDADQIFAAVIAENQRACRPPLSEAEIRATVAKSASAWVYRAQVEGDAEAVDAAITPWHVDVHPADLFSAAATPPPFDPAAWPAPIADYALDVARRVGGDPSIAAWTMLAMVAGILPDAIKIQPRQHDTGWTESARIWVASIGSPATKKSPMGGSVLRAVHHAQSQMTEDYQAAIGPYERARKAWERASAKDPDTAGDEPVKPRHERLLVEDATLEAIGELLQANPGGIVSVQDELAAQIGSWDAYSDKGAGKDRAHWLKLKEGGPHYIDRIRRGHGHVPNWSASLVGNIQPQRIADINKTHKLGADGMLQRFLLIPVADAVPGEDVAPGEIMAWWPVFLERLVEVRRACEGRHIRVTVSADAAEDMRQLMVRAEALTYQVADEGLASHLAKLPGEIARITLVYHAILQIDASRARGMSPDVALSFPVARATVATVRRLVLGTIVPALHCFYASVLGRDAAEMTVTRVAAAVLAHGENEITARELRRLVRKVSRDQLLAACQDLEISGWLQPMEQRRRNQQAWFVHPAVHELYAQQREIDAQRRQRARDVIQEAIRMGKGE